MNAPIPIKDMLGRYLLCGEIMRTTDGKEWTDASNESWEIERTVRARLMSELGLTGAELELIGSLL
jgi:hypothetical protein